MLSKRPYMLMDLMRARTIRPPKEPNIKSNMGWFGSRFMLRNWGRWPRVSFTMPMHGYLPRFGARLTACARSPHPCP